MRTIRGGVMTGAEACVTGERADGNQIRWDGFRCVIKGLFWKLDLQTVWVGRWAGLNAWAAEFLVSMKVGEANGGAGDEDECSEKESKFLFSHERQMEFCQALA